MNTDEKKLIEDLFFRLHQTEIQSPNRDNIAEELIKNLLEKYPNSPYYMAQTILVQETAIKKLNDKVSELESHVLKDKKDKKNVSIGFLSNLFGTKKNQSVSETYSNSSINPLHNRAFDSNTSPFSSQTRSGTLSQIGAANNTGGFFSGALQTATGVAGGVVMANMLTNLFQNKKSEEEVINSAHNVDSSHVESNSIDNDPAHNQYINYDRTNSDNHVEECHPLNCDVHDDNDYDNFEDDNFI
ncbi:MAG: DUF2076 domain-containing protein [Buchnera aphidicola (Meitanaphis flavogallis)]